MIGYKSENYASKKNNKCEKRLYWNNHDLNLSRLKCIQICEDDEWYIDIKVSGGTLALTWKNDAVLSAVANH